MLNKPKFGMIREIHVTDDEGNDYVVKLEYNGMTSIYYMNLIGSDMMQDMVDSLSNEDSMTIFKNLSKEEMENPETMPIEKRTAVLEVLNKTNYMKFFRNFIAVLFYTAHRDCELSLETILADYLPSDLMENEAIVNAASEMLNMKVDKLLKKNTKLLSKS